MNVCNGELTEVYSGAPLTYSISHTFEMGARNNL